MGRGGVSILFEDTKKKGEGVVPPPPPFFREGNLELVWKNTFYRLYKLLIFLIFCPFQAEISFYFFYNEVKNLNIIFFKQKLKLCILYIIIFKLQTPYM